MKLAFVIAAYPKEPTLNGRESRENWLDFVGNLQRHGRPPAGMQTLHDNVWLIPLANGLPFLNELIQLGHSYSVPINILFLEDAPTWITYPPAKPEKPTV